MTIPCMLIYASLAAAAAIAAHGSQVPLTHFPEAGRPARRPSETFLGSPEFDGFIEEIMKNGSIPGVSLGVVRLGEDRQPIVQLGSWGRKTEDGNGHDLSPDVRTLKVFCGFIQ